MLCSAVYAFRMDNTKQKPDDPVDFGNSIQCRRFYPLRAMLRFFSKALEKALPKDVDIEE